MPPPSGKKRGRPSRQIRQTVPKTETQDDDAFEDEHRTPRLRPRFQSVQKKPPSSQTKLTKASCQLTRSKSNGKSDKTNKHVDKNCNMSSPNSLESNSDTVTLIESEGENDISLDLTPKRKLRSSDHEDTIQPTKRKKLNVFNDDIVSLDEHDGVLTETSDSNEQPHGDTSGSQNEDSASNKSHDECASNGATVSEAGDEFLEIDADTDLVKAIGTSEQLSHEPKEPVTSPDEPESNISEEEEEEAETNKIVNEAGHSSNGDDDQENDDGDVIDAEIDEDDIFKGLIEDEPIQSPVPGPKIPSWKQAAMSGEPMPKRQIVNTFRKTITNTTTNVASSPVVTPAASMPTTTAPSDEQHRQPKVIFKIPHVSNVHSASTANRDPRTKGPAPPTTTATGVAENSAQTPQSITVISNAGGQRVSVKDRLGNKFAGKSSSSFIIPNETSTQNVSPASTGLPVQKQQPKPSGLYTNTFRRMQEAKNQQTDKNIQQPHPDLPSFVNEALKRKLPAELKMPAFATGTQKYEPLFFRIFERTCRVFMHDECNSHDCSFDHQLPDLEIFRKALDRVSKERVVEFYDEFICRNQKLFDFYLPEFTAYFGKHSITAKLKQMVEDCNERKVQFHFMKIIEGFQMTGKSFSKALKDVIQAIPCRTMKTSKEIIKLVLHQRNENIRPFIDVLDTISKQENFKFPADSVNRMMFIHRDIKLKELSDVIWRIINANFTNLQMYDGELVTQFMDEYGKGA